MKSSGVRSVFEEQGRKEGHFSAYFGSREGSSAHVLASKRVVYHVLRSQRGILVCFANQECTLACFFGSQEGTLACVLKCPRRKLEHMRKHPPSSLLIPLPAASRTDESSVGSEAQAC